MGRSAVSLNQTTLKRLLLSARAAGLEIAEIQISPDSTIRILSKADQITETELDSPSDILARLRMEDHGEN